MECEETSTAIGAQCRSCAGKHGEPYSRQLCCTCYNHHHHKGTLWKFEKVDKPAKSKSLPRGNKRVLNGRPAPFRRRGFSIHVRRGPDDRGRWYWQATTYDKETRKRSTVWVGWATEQWMVDNSVRLFAEALALGHIKRPQTSRLRAAGDHHKYDRKRVPKGASVVYCVSEGTSFVKIGLTKRLENRMTSLQTANPRAITLIGALPGGRALEKELHRRFDRWRVRGEWFIATPEILATFTSGPDVSLLLPTVGDGAAGAEE